MNFLKTMMLAVVFTSSMPVWSSDFIDGVPYPEPIRVTPAENMRAQFKLYISSKKTALERLEKYGFIKLTTKDNMLCGLGDESFYCEVIGYGYYEFLMQDDVFTRIWYRFNSSKIGAGSQSLTLPQTEQDELINILNMITDNPQESTRTLNRLIQDYQKRAAEPNFDESAFVNYNGVIIELRGDDQKFHTLFIN